MVELKIKGPSLILGTEDVGKYNPEKSPQSDAAGEAQIRSRETILLSYFIADFDVMPSGRMVVESFCFLNPVETTCMWK